MAHKLAALGSPAHNRPVVVTRAHLGQGGSKAAADCGRILDEAISQMRSPCLARATSAKDGPVFTGSAAEGGQVAIHRTVGGAATGSPHAGVVSEPCRSSPSDGGRHHAMVAPTRKGRIDFARTTRVRLRIQSVRKGEPVLSHPPCQRCPRKTVSSKDEARPLMGGGQVQVGLP